MNAYFFSHRTLPPPPLSLRSPRGGTAGVTPQQHRPPSRQSPLEVHGRGESCAAAEATYATADEKSPYAQKGSRDPRTAVATAVFTPMTMNSDRADVAVISEGAAAHPLEVPRHLRTSPSSATAAAPRALSAPARSSIPCLVLFTPQGPRPLDGLRTVSLSHAGSSLLHAQGALRNQSSSLNRLSASSSAAVGAGRRDGDLRRGAKAGARPSRPQVPDGLRCVYDRDTRSRLLHISPNTEVNFASHLRLPTAVTAPSVPIAALHTIAAVQFCVAAPTASATLRRAADGACSTSTPASPVPPPGSFYIEVVLCSGSTTAISTAKRSRGAATPHRSGGNGDGYRLRFTNAVRDVQWHPHHAIVPLQCVQFAQWVQLFFDLDALLLVCHAAGAMVAKGAPCRLQQLRVGVGGSAVTTGGMYVRRIIAGYGLPLPPLSIDYIVTTEGDARVEWPLAPHVRPFEKVDDANREANTNHAAEVDSSGGEVLYMRRKETWILPEAFRLPVEAGATLSVFVRSGEESILREAPMVQQQATVDAPPAHLSSASSDGDGAVRKVADVESQYLGATHRSPTTTTSATSGALRAAKVDHAAPPIAQSQSLTETRGSRGAVPGTKWGHVPRPATGATAGEGQRPLAPQRELAKVPHQTALTLLRRRERERQLNEQAAAAAAARPSAHRSLSLAFELPTSPSASSCATSSPTASDEAEMFVVREVSMAKQLAPSIPPQYPANQLLLGDSPKPGSLLLSKTPGRIGAKVGIRAHVDAGEGYNGVASAAAKMDDAVVEATGRRSSSRKSATVKAVTAAEEKQDGGSSARSTSTSSTTELSKTSYSSVLDLMQEMRTRVRCIHRVLAGAGGQGEEKTVATGHGGVPTPPLLQQSSPPPATVEAVGTVALPTTNLTIMRPTAAASSAAPPTPMYGVAHPATASPSPISPADLVEGVRDGLAWGQAPSATAAAGHTQPQVREHNREKATTAEEATTADAKTILEMWSSTEMPLDLPAAFDAERLPAPASTRTTLAARLQAHQAALSSSSNASSSRSPSSRPTDAKSPSDAMLPPPSSAVTSWTFHSSPLAPLPDSTVGALLDSAMGEKLPAAPHNPDGVVVAAPRSLRPSATASQGAQLTKAVVWRRPLLMSGKRPPMGDATRRALQDEVRVGDDTPERRPSGGQWDEAAKPDKIPLCNGGGRVVEWSARHQPSATPSGEVRTPLSTGQIESLSSRLPAYAHLNGGVGVGVEGQAAAAPSVVLASSRSYSTVGSFHMWLPSPMPMLSAGPMRYPSNVTTTTVTTPPSSGDARRGGSLAASPAVSAASADGGSGRPPRLGIGAVLPTTRPPLPPTSGVRKDIAATPAPPAPAQLLLPPGSDVNAARASEEEEEAGAPSRKGSLPSNDKDESARYLYDGVLQCYLDVFTNTYVAKA